MEPVEVELLLPHAVLIPEALDREELWEELLAANGTPASANECIVSCGAKNGCVALVALDRTIRQKIAETFPRARFSTPLEQLPKNREKCLWICRKGPMTYIKLLDGERLLLAEVIPASDEAEIAYFVDELGKQFPLAGYELQITGEEPGKLRKWIGNQFRKIVCE